MLFFSVMFPLEGKFHEDKSIVIECVHDYISSAKKKQTKNLTKICWIQGV